MQPLPASVTAYKRTREFDERTIPKGLLRSHSTAAGVWGRICVLEGELLYRILEPEPSETVLSPDTSGIVAPELEHEARGPVRFFVEFLR